MLHHCKMLVNHSVRPNALYSQHSHKLTKVSLIVWCTYPEQFIRGWALSVVLSEALLCETSKLGRPAHIDNREWWTATAGLRAVQRMCWLTISWVLWDGEEDCEGWGTVLSWDACCRELGEREREREREVIWYRAVGALLGNSRGSPSAISMAVIPRDHWSLCEREEEKCSDHHDTMDYYY